MKTVQFCSVLIVYASESYQPHVGTDVDKSLIAIAAVPRGVDYAMMSIFGIQVQFLQFHILRRVFSCKERLSTEVSLKAFQLLV